MLWLKGGKGGETVKIIAISLFLFTSRPYSGYIKFPSDTEMIMTSMGV
jgi:hypothetical protein